MTADIGLILGVFCCLVITGLVKVAGAEPRSRTLLRTGWRVVASVAESSGQSHEKKLQRLLDLVSLWASRQVAIAADSRLRRYDLLRDLRLGHNLNRLKGMSSGASESVRMSVNLLCRDVAGFYRGGQRSEDRDTVLASLQRCFMKIFQDGEGLNHRRMLALLLSTRMCVDPARSALPEHGGFMTPLLEI